MRAAGRLVAGVFLVENPTCCLYCVAGGRGETVGPSLSLYIDFLLYIVCISYILIIIISMIEIVSRKCGKRALSHRHVRQPECNLLLRWQSGSALTNQVEKIFF